MLRKRKFKLAFTLPIFCRTTGFFCLGLNALIFGYLRAADPILYRALMREDNLVEWLTVVWLLLAALTLLATARRERSVHLRWLWLLGGVALLFGAGEEISWGQRIFGLATPDFLLALNAQNELNVHNINVGLFADLYQNGIYLLCLASSAAWFFRKGSVCGIPLPSMPLIAGFMIALEHNSIWRTQGETIANFAYFATHREMILTVLLMLYALFTGQRRVFTVAAASAAIVLALTNANIRAHAPPPSGEAREYLLGLACLLWTLEIWRARGGLKRAGSAEPGRRRRLNGTRAGTLALMVGSLGLVPFVVYASARTEAIALEALAQARAAGALVGHAEFEVYLDEGQLIYAREPCRPADVAATFFLHVIPVHEGALPGERRQYGFDNLDYSIYQRVMLVGERCIMIAPLPAYGIAGINTGQFSADGERLWKVAYRSPEYLAMMEEALAQARAAGALVGHTWFEVYLDEGRLIYAREACRASEVEAIFFLHVIPVNEEDLPDERRQYGFDHLDFGFGEHSALVGEQCIAMVPLPEYGIAGINTGRFSADGELLWEVAYRSPEYLAMMEEALAQARAAGALVGHTWFEVYLDEGRLIYAREACRASEVEAIFFLHVIPVNEEDLPDERRQYGFDHLDFGFGEHGVMAGERCIAMVPLPEYGIAGINTGRFSADGELLWEVAYRSPEYLVRMEATPIEALTQARAAGALVGRSEFEVYLDEGQLIYSREPCRPADVAAKFFLHVIPVHEGDLPDERRQYGFDNLDFAYSEHGVMAGEQCIAMVPLPAYGIAGIRTGQYIPDGEQLWEVEYTVGGAEGGHSP